MTATLTVRLPDGTTDSRKSARPYTHAVIVVQTEAYRAAVLGRIESEIAKLEAVIARETPRAATAEDQAAYAAATARVAYLDEEIEEATVCHGGEVRSWAKPRWLTDAFRATCKGGLVRDVLDAAHDAVRKTARGTIEEAQEHLETRRESLARNSASIVVGYCYVASWHHDFHLAQKGADKVLGYNPGCKVTVTDKIEVKLPRARKVA